jgi:hypothetical protein
MSTGFIHKGGVPEIVSLPPECSDLWITLHVGRTQTIAVPGIRRPPIRVWGAAAEDCHYWVEAEGTFLAIGWVDGKDISKYVCEQDWIGICQCKTQ